jgi:hypothetical protein
MSAVFVVIATEIAVLAASPMASDRAAAEALARLFEAHGVTARAEPVAEAAQVHAITLATFAPLGQARRLVAEARKHDLLVEPDQADAKLDQAIERLAALRAIPGVEDELADAWILRGVVRFHSGDQAAARAAFARARALDPTRRLTPFEVHPDIARLYEGISPDGGVAPPLLGTEASAPSPRALSPVELCDVLWLDGAVVIRARTQGNRSRFAAARYDARARAWTETRVAAGAAQLIDALLGSPTVLATEPALTLPAEPPDAGPPRFWQRGWFWAAVAGAVALTGGSVAFAEVTRETQTRVVVAPNAFGGR